MADRISNRVLVTATGTNAIVSALSGAAPVANLKFHLLRAIFGLSGAAVANAVRATITDGTTTIAIGCIGGTTFIEFASSADQLQDQPVSFAVNTQVTAALAAGGASVVGDVTLQGYWAK